MTPELSAAEYATLDYLYDRTEKGHENALWDHTPAGTEGGRPERNVHDSLLAKGFMGTLDKARANGFHSMVTITPAGIEHMRQVQELRNSRAARARECRDRLLTWYDTQGTEKKTDPEEFLATDKAFFFGQLFRADEVRAAGEWLAIKGLLAQSATLGGITYMINPAGRNAMDDGGLSAHLDAQRHPTIGTINRYEVNNHGDNNQIAAGVDIRQQQWQSTSQVAPGYEDIASAMAEVLRRLPELGLNAEDHQTVEESAKDVLAEVQKPEPKRSWVRRTVASVIGALTIAKIGGLEEAGGIAVTQILELVTSAQF